MEESILLKELEEKDQVLHVGKDYIPGIERKLRNTVRGIFLAPTSAELSNVISETELLSEAVFWSIGELVNNANKANNRWALLRNALFQRIQKEGQESSQEKIYEDIDYAIEHNQSDLLKKYSLLNLDLTASILKLIEVHKTNSFAISERFQKKIDVTLRIRNKGDQRILTVNVINNSPITVIDKQRVEYNLEKIKEDLIRAGRSPFEAAVQIYDKLEDHAGGGFGAGLRSIILFLREGYRPFQLDIIYSKMIQYRSAGQSTIFSIELPLPKVEDLRQKAAS